MQTAGSSARFITKMLAFCKHKFYIMAILLGTAIFFTACEEGAKTAPNSTNKNFPSQMVMNARILQRDSGRIKLRATAPLIQKYDFVDSPYVVAPRGIAIDYFDPKKPKTPGKISANYARLNQLRQLYEARGNVRVLTQDGQLFTMQRVFWDQRNGKIYTGDTVYIKDKDGSSLVATGGMRAKQDFSEYTFFNTRGDISTKKIPDQQK